jgi:hypothetical protein
MQVVALVQPEPGMPPRVPAHAGRRAGAAWDAATRALQDYMCTTRLRAASLAAEIAD